MKINIYPITQISFKPFKLVLEIESQEEANFLWLLFNSNPIRRSEFLNKNNPNNRSKPYDHNMNDKIWNVIEDQS